MGLSDDRIVTPYAAMHRGGDRSQPFITWYEDTYGHRVELSRATLLNGVAKCAGLLRDDYDIQPGDTVALHLPMHWQRAVWLGACWSVRAIAAPDYAGRAGLAIVGQGAPSSELALEVLEVDLSPLALPARNHPDIFAPISTPALTDPAMLLADGTVLDAGEVMSVAQVLADAWRLGKGGRLLAVDPVSDAHTGLAMAAGWLAALAVPLVVDGSVVIVAHEDPALRTSRMEIEHVSAVSKEQ